MKTIELYFRGDRNYLHGTTLFDYILNAYVINKYEPKNIDFSFHKLTNKRCIIVPEEGSLPQDQLVGQYKDNETQLFIYETKDAITERFPYDENGIIKKCFVKGDEITISENIDDYSFIEKIIAAYKYLLIGIYKDSYGRYLFARLTLSFIPEGEIKIKQERIISNKFFEGRIRQGDKDVGEIFFAAK